MSEKVTAKPIPECRFDLIYIADVNKDGVEDMVMLQQALRMNLIVGDGENDNDSEIRSTPIGAEIIITDVDRDLEEYKGEAAAKGRPPMKPPLENDTEFMFNTSSPTVWRDVVKINPSEIGDLKAMWHDGKRLEIGKKWKGKTVSGFVAKVVLAGKDAKGKGVKHVMPVMSGGAPDDNAVKKAEAFLTKIGGAYELSIRTYVQFKDGSETEIVQHDANPMCVGQVREVVEVTPSQGGDRKENE